MRRREGTNRTNEEYKNFLKSFKSKERNLKRNRKIGK